MLSDGVNAVNLVTYDDNKEQVHQVVDQLGINRYVCSDPVSNNKHKRLVKYTFLEDNIHSYTYTHEHTYMFGAILFI